jgi:hypothetical protein
LRAKIAKYSGKYAKVLDSLFGIMKGGGGKVFMYHSFVRVSGAFLVANMLARNGLIGMGASPGETTKCALCGERSAAHEKGAAHEFAAARYVVVHGEMPKRRMVQNLEYFNDLDNLDGSRVMVVVGTRVMREAYDLVACRHVFLLNRPDNVPSWIIRWCSGSSARCIARP